MPLSTVQTYLEPGDAETAYAAAEVELTPTGYMPYRMHVVRVELEDVWLHQVDENGPRVKHAVQSPNRAFIKFLTRPGQELVTDGAALPYQGLLRHGQGHRYYDRTSSAVRWASMSLPVDRLAATGNLLPLRDSMVVIPPADAMARLRRLHVSAASLARNSPRVLQVPEVAHGLEQSLVEALVGCLRSARIEEASWGQRCHETIMRKFRRILDDNPDRPSYVPEICAAIGVPERTLRYCCQEHLGMSPKRYLVLRRMNLAYRALDAASAAETTVTEIATRFGFWHFGRFAGSYRSTFGEPPSVTLHRPPR